MKKSFWIRLMSFYPPYLGAGIRLRYVASDFREIRVELGLHWWNRNYVGTQFGGSLYSMVDPFFMLMVMENLGRDYIVWDKAATIRFKRPGRGRVIANFQITEEQLQSLRSEVALQGKSNPVFTVLILDESGERIAEVEKTLSVKKKGDRMSV